MTTELERHLAYAEAQVNHPDPQLRPLLAAMYKPSLLRLRTLVAREAAKPEDWFGAPGNQSRAAGTSPDEEFALTS